MDSQQRARYKQLANDSIIATYGYDNAQSRLAEALEKCLEELERRARCPICGDGDNPDWEMVTAVFDELGLQMEAK